MRPDTVTTFAVPTEDDAKLPLAEAVSSVTVSPDTTPTSVAVPVFSVAVAILSYTLLLAVMPLTVSAFAVMSAVVVGCVSE